MSHTIDYDQLVKNLGAAVEEAATRAEAKQREAMAAQHELTALRAQLDMAIQLRHQVQSPPHQEISHASSPAPVDPTAAGSPQPRTRRGKRNADTD